MLEEKVANKINEMMEKGYEARREDKYKLACKHWEELWDYIKSVYESSNYDCINKFDEDYLEYNNTENNKYSEECVYNWVSDYENMLSYTNELHKRINFCEEYLKMFDADYSCSFEEDEFGNYEESDYNHVMEIESAIADSYNRLGDKEKGEKSFEKNIKSNPTNGFGWIRLSEMQESKKAVETLKEALEVEYLENKMDVQFRLKELYESIGMKEEADDIEIDYDDGGIPLDQINNLADMHNDMIDNFIEGFVDFQNRKNG
ncbi:MAG: hypothetical protein ABF289_13300 [Clostridiales bacterium]